MAPTTPSSSQQTTKPLAKQDGLKKPEPQSTSFNVAVFCLFLVGIGSAIGFMVFYAIYKESCSTLLLEKDRSHNSSQIDLQVKYNKALEDVRNCQVDSQAKGELQELQGRLQAQAVLSDKHQDLLERHEKSLERIHELQQSNEGSQSQIQALKEEMKSMQLTVEESSQQLLQGQIEKDAQILHTNNLLDEKTKENARLNEGLNSCGQSLQNTERKMGELKNLVQQQNLASVVAMFGEGPYVIRFNLEFPSEPIEPNYFEIKIKNARDLPHTTLSLLNMIDNGLYVDTTIDFAKNDIIRGGSPSTVEPQNVKTSVLRRFANFGYSAYNTLFFENESSPFTPCRHYSFGLDDRGPGFIIYMTDDGGVDARNNPYNCPGVITKGHDTLARLMKSHTNENGELTWKVPIVATYLVSLNDEL